MSQEEVIAIIKDCAAKLGRTPRLAELEEMGQNQGSMTCIKRSAPLTSTRWKCAGLR